MNLLNLYDALIRAGFTDVDRALAGITWNSSMAECAKLGAVFYGSEHVKYQDVSDNSMLSRSLTAQVCYGVDIWAVFFTELLHDGKIAFPAVTYSEWDDSRVLIHHSPTIFRIIFPEAIQRYCFVLARPPDKDEYDQIRPRVPSGKILTPEQLRSIGYDE